MNVHETSANTSEPDALGPTYADIFGGSSDLSSLPIDVDPVGMSNSGSSVASRREEEPPGEGGNGRAGQLVSGETESSQGVLWPVLRWDNTRKCFIDQFGREYRVKLNPVSESSEMDDLPGRRKESITTPTVHDVHANYGDIDANESTEKGDIGKLANVKRGGKLPTREEFKADLSARAMESARRREEGYNKAKESIDAIRNDLADLTRGPGMAATIKDNLLRTLDALAVERRELENMRTPVGESADKLAEERKTNPPIRSAFQSMLKGEAKGENAEDRDTWQDQQYDKGRSMLKITAPDPYDGSADYEKFSEWAENTETYYQINRAREEDIPRVVKLLLSGKAHRWYVNNVQRNPSASGKADSA